MKFDEEHAAHRGMIAYFREANAPDAADAENAIEAEDALVHPQSGIVLAMSFGTSYLLHLPPATALEAIAQGCKPRETWSDGTATELAETFGVGWVFGRWLDEEVRWLRAAFAHHSKR